MRRVARLIYRHGWSLVALAAGLYLASRVHQKPSWADPDFTIAGSYAALYWGVASFAVILMVVALATARTTPRIIEAAAVLVGSVVLAGVVLAATDLKPVTGTATVEGLPGQPSVMSGSVECMGPSGRVTRIDAPRWKIVLSPGDELTPPRIDIEISQGAGFMSLEGQLAAVKLADAWVRGRAVLSYELAAGPGVLTFTWDCGQAPVLSPITSFLWWITADPLLPGFIVVVALVSLSAGISWSRRRGGTTPS